MVIVVSDLRGVVHAVGSPTMSLGRGLETGECHLWCTGSRGRLQGNMLPCLMVSL